MQEYFHKTILFTALLILFVISANCWAETGGFKISDYIPERFEDFEWRVDGNFRLSGSDSENDIEENQFIPFNNNRKSNRTVDNQDYNFSFRTYQTYDYITIQNYLNVNTSLQGNTKIGNRDTKQISLISNRLETATNELSAQSYNLNFNNNLDAGHYISKDFFLSAKSYFSYSYNEMPKYKNEYYLKYEYDNDPYFLIRQDWENSSERQDARNINLGGQLLMGWGRQYEGYYASTALYMIEELKDDGLLLKEPTQENMLMLSEIIYQKKLRHSIDSRLHKIESLNEIITFLEKEELISGSGPYDYLLIQDVWDYFPRNDRRFGSRVRIGVGMDYNYDSRHGSYTSDNRNFDYSYDTDNPDVIDTLAIGSSDVFGYNSRKNDFHGTFLAINAEHSLPLDHKWQLTFSTENKYYLSAESDYNYYSLYDLYGHSPIITDEVMNYDDYYQLRFISDIDYIVSSRTSWEVIDT